MDWRLKFLAKEKNLPEKENNTSLPSKSEVIGHAIISIWHEIICSDTDVNKKMQRRRRRRWKHCPLGLKGWKNEHCMHVWMKEEQEKDEKQDLQNYSRNCKGNREEASTLCWVNKWSWRWLEGSLCSCFIHSLHACVISPVSWNFILYFVIREFHSLLWFLLLQDHVLLFYFNKISLQERDILLSNSFR